MKKVDQITYDPKITMKDLKRWGAKISNDGKSIKLRINLVPFNCLNNYKLK